MSNLNHDWSRIYKDPNPLYPVNYRMAECCENCERNDHLSKEHGGTLICGLNYEPVYGNYVCDHWRKNESC